MSRHSSGKSRQATHGAIDHDRLEALLKAASPAQDDTAARQRTIQEEFRQNNITRVAASSRLNRGSAEVLLDNPWLQPFLDKTLKLGAKIGARVTEIRSYGVIALTIKTPKDKHDLAKVEVSRNGKLVVTKTPRSEALQLVIAQALPTAHEPQQHDKRDAWPEYRL